MDKICNSDKDSFFKIILITADIIVEYKIWGIWYKKSNHHDPLLFYAMFHLWKKKALTVKYNEKDKNNNDILIKIKL